MHPPSSLRTVASVIAAAGLIVPASTGAAAGRPRLLYDAPPVRAGDPFVVRSVRPDGSGDRAVTTGAGALASPDGRWVAVQRAGALWVVGADASRAHAIAPFARAYRWSQDAARLAFSDAGTGVFEVRADGSGRRLVYRGPADPVGYADHRRRLVVMRQDDHHRFQLRLVDLRTGGVRSLRARSSSAAVSPDGRRIAYGAAWVTDLRTLHRRRVARGAVVAGTRPWSPDGRRLVVERGLPPSIAVVGVAHGQIRSLTRGTGLGDLRPAWSPDGRWIAFVRGGAALRVVRPTGPAGGSSHTASRRTTSRGYRGEQRSHGRMVARMRRTTIAAGTCALLALVAHTPAVAQQDPATQPDAAITDGSAQRALDAARTAWQSYGARSYRMRVRIQCFCAPDYTKARTVEVRGGRIVHAAASIRRIATVPRLLRIVQGAIDAKVSNLDVRYDPGRGIPRSIFIDTSPMIADEEVGYGVLAFRRL